MFDDTREGHLSVSILLIFKVPPEVGESYAREIGGSFVEMSVRDDKEVKDVFQDICELCYALLRS